MAAPGGGPADDASGRLDLDALDDVHAVDLDVVGDDRPRAGDRAAEWLETRGVLPFARRHRGLVAAAAAVVVVASVAGARAWAGRPPSLDGPPQVTASLGTRPPAAAELAPNGQATQVGLDVDLAIAEPATVGVEVAGLVGPGLGDVAGLPLLRTDRDRPAVVPARGALACGTTADVARLGEARDVDYRLVVVRTNGAGARAVDQVPLTGAAPLLDFVRTTCLQRTADRELRVVGGSVKPLDHVVGVRLALTLATSGSEPWTDVRVSYAARPALVTQGPTATVAPDRPGTVVANLWPSDCATPLGDVSGGVLVSASPPGSPDPGADPPVTLSLPAPLQVALAQRIHALCGPDVPTLQVTGTALDAGSGPGSGGMVGIDVRLRSSAQWLEIGTTVTDAGRLEPVDPQPLLEGGTAEAQVVWRLPSCAALVDSGLPRLQVFTVDADTYGGMRRPFLLPLDGPTLGTEVARLCPDLAPEIRVS